MRSRTAIGVIAAAVAVGWSSWTSGSMGGVRLQGAQGAGRAAASSPAWRQWGGPDRNFIIPNAPRLADAWPESGPPVLWTRPLGTGHSTVLVDEGRLYTMYRGGNGRNDRGPYDTEEVVVSLDAATGKTLWEHKYPSALADFSRGAGPDR